jgi:hypothetical protein
LDYAVTEQTLRARTARPLLDLAIDLGELPAAADVAETMAATLELWDHCVRLVRRFFPPDLAEIERREYRRHPKTGRLVPMDVELRVKRLSLHSPLEVLFVAVANKSAPVLWGGAALFALERILQMIQSWQMGRLDYRERRAQVQAVEHEAEQLLARHATQVAYEHSAERRPATDRPRTPDSEAVEAVRVLSRSQIVRAEIRADENES